MAFVSILSQIKLLFGPLVIQLVWYILEQSFTSVSVTRGSVNIHHYSPPLRWIIVNYYSTNCNTIQIWSWCSRYLSSVGNRYPAIYVASYVGRKSKVKKCRQKDLKMLRALLSICSIIKQFSPAQSCGISSDFSRLGLRPRRLSIRRYSARFRRIIVN